MKLGDTVRLRDPHQGQEGLVGTVDVLEEAEEPDRIRVWGAWVRWRTLHGAPIPDGVRAYLGAFYLLGELERVKGEGP